MPRDEANGRAAGLGESKVLTKWIGLAEVSAKEVNDILGPEEGAFAVVVALAKGSEDFIARVAHAADQLGLNLLQCTDVDPYADRVGQHEVEESVRRLAASLTPAEPLRFDDFCIYPRGGTADE